ncbi:unnamed protein product [Ilex paraguariensis]|uniref:protein-serine/threonine phosphatase n=1 Tax=Ilex paraguariensis TaxID=185542 RepID=A0ABC8RJ17_9AQUA
MLIADLSRFVLEFNNNREQRTLEVSMVKKEEECKSVHDVEEGEISDSASVEEISAADFIKPESKVSISNTSTNSDSKPRVWTMRDMYKYPMSRNCASDLYNFAWAQAVQNKPLAEILRMELKATENSDLKMSSSSNSLSSREDNKSGSVNSSAQDLDSKVIIDVDDDVKMEEGEKEEGELEEGEIDLDFDVVEQEDSNKNWLDASESDFNVKEDELEKRVDSIREVLRSVNVDDAMKSYSGVCSRLQNSLENLQEVVSNNWFLTKDALVQLSFTAIQTVNSVLCSMGPNQMEHNRDTMSRLLAYVTSLKPPLFPSEQMKKIDVMKLFLESSAISSSAKDCHKENESEVTERVNQNDSDSLAENTNQDLTSSKKCALDSMSTASLDQKDHHTSLDSLKSGAPGYKGRGVLLPLLDLHKDHDADSLPSPTRETVPLLPTNKAIVFGDGVVKPELHIPRGAFETDNTSMHRYETDALKAVSSYQEKFGRSSFLMNDRLPSPTPSEEADDVHGDIGGEVSSSSIVRKVNSLSAPASTSIIVSSVPHMDITSGQVLANASNAGPLSSGPNSILRASAKTRDPRLRFANSDAGALNSNHHRSPTVNNEPKVVPLVGIINLRKQKTFEEPVLDGPASKRQRNGLTDVGVGRDVETMSRSGGWLEDRGTIGLPVINRNHVVGNVGLEPRKLENSVTCSGTSGVPAGNVQLPVTGTCTTDPLHSLLKDIAVNPAIWMNLIKLEQQKSVDPAKSITPPPSSNSILGAAPTMNIAPPKPAPPEPRSVGILQTPKTALVDELGKVRMKPRDPRRILHSNTIQKGGCTGSDQSKIMTSNGQGQSQEDQSDKKSVSSQSITPPDITRQFTKNLKNIADIMCVSQASMTPVAVPKISSSPPVQVHSSRVDVKVVVSESSNLQSGSGSASEEPVGGPSQSQNSWGDVEHLFEGFDDQQKAAIQRERARRIEEQKKMFAARKLCLVLDLDHTLLNSAKFAEVEPMHDEILRKKEEQDREKPQRHLFRFPHMGMWTKLRPGIWTFLEKASQLYELHLYTMGNKLYATEMAKVLDPRGNLFAGRVISKGDEGDLFDGDERVPKSKDLEGVLGMESAVVIIDDSVRVWPHNKLNLIVVERYIYFPCSRRQFGLPGPSLLEIDHDERQEDGTLASSLAVIERIHQNFFSELSLDDADVRNILASEQHKILSGCHVVFSRVFPVGEANPHLHPLWQTAEQFGAVCTTQIDEQVTHVVANSLGTDKVNWALSTGRFVVHPGWVEASALLYRRANEQDFAIKP